MAEPKIDVDGLPLGVSGPFDTIVGVDEATGAARRFPMPQPGTPRSYATRASLPAASGFSEGYTVWVNNDPTPANNGTWAVLGGVWVQSADRVTGLEQSKLDRGAGSSPIQRAGSAPYKYSKSSSGGYAISARPEVPASGIDSSRRIMLAPGEIISMREMFSVTGGKAGRATLSVAYTSPTTAPATIEFGVSWYGSAGAYISQSVAGSRSIIRTTVVDESFTFGADADLTTPAGAETALPFVRHVGPAGATALVTYFDVENEAPIRRVANLELGAALTSGKMAAIILKAKRDGWHALYTADTPADRRLVDAGDRFNVVEIKDSLGNARPVVQSSGSLQPPLGSIKSGMVVLDAANSVLTQSGDDRKQYAHPYTVMVVAGKAGAYGNVVDGAAGNTAFRSAILSSATGWTFWAGTNVNVADTQSGVSVLSATFDGANSQFSVNGVVVTGGNPGSGAMLGVSIGGRTAGTSTHEGPIGPVLIYEGALSDEKRESMERMLLRAIDFEPDLPVLTTIGGYATIDNDDNLRGDIVKTPDKPGATGSTIKMLTALTVLHSGIPLSTVCDVDSYEAETVSGSTADLQTGDLITVENLLYGMALPSGNDAAFCLARHVGQYLLNQESGSGDARNRFYEEANALAGSLGLTGTVMGNPASSGTTTARDLCRQIRWIYDNPVLRTIFGAQTRMLTVTGPNARTYTITHTINAAQLPGFICGKTGVGGNLAISWEHEGVIYHSGVKEAAGSNITDMAAILAYIKRKAMTN